MGGIAIPATITTGKTKCSLSQTIVLTYQPTFDLTLTITPPSTTSNNFSGFITIDGTVTNSIRFDPSKSAASISVCSFMSTTAGTYPFSLSLSGTNMSSYALTNPTLNVSVKEMMTLTFPTAVDVPRSGCSPRQ